MSFSPSVFVAKAIRWSAYWLIEAPIFVARQIARLANYLEDERTLDRPTPWLIGLMLFALFLWLVMGLD